jgi:hypothetical protein
MGPIEACLVIPEVASAQRWTVACGKRVTGRMPRTVFAVLRREVGRLMIVGLGNAGVGKACFGVSDQSTVHSPRSTVHSPHARAEVGARARCRAAPSGGPPAPMAILPRCWSINAPWTASSGRQREFCLERTIERQHIVGVPRMKAQDRYLSYVQWSEEDRAYIGYCPDLFPAGGVCHAKTAVKAYALLRIRVANPIWRAGWRRVS